MSRIRRITGWNGFWWIIAVVCVLGMGIILTWCNWDVLRGCQESVSATVRNMGLLTGGIIAILLTVWRSLVAERQADTARRQFETSQRVFLNERYQKGAEMLRSDNLSARMQGIDVLCHLEEEQLREYHIQIIRLFCAFARHPAKDDGTGGHVDGEPHPPLREDVQAVMAAISGRTKTAIEYEKTAGFRLDLHDAELVKLSLFYANLSGANLLYANLAYAILLKADLSDSALIDANLTGAKLGGANLSEAELTNAQLVGARLDGANLSQTTLYRAILFQVSAHKADFSGANLASANLNNANLTNADLSYTTIRNTDLSHAILRDTNLSGAFIGKGIHPDPSDPESAFTRVTQHQLDQAIADPHNPPTIECGIVDTETGEQLIWRGRTTQQR